MSDMAMKVVGVLSPLILAGLGWLSMKLAQLINAKVKNEYVRGALSRLDDAVFAAVREVQQVSVDALKESGTFDATAAQRAKDAALESIKSHLGERGLAEIAKILGWESIEAALSTRVEAVVHKMGETSPQPG